MAKQYWLQREGKTYGPYSGGKLKKLAALGRICDDDQLSADKQSWQLAGTVPGLFSLTAPPPQIASSDAPPSPEMSPRTGTASKTRRQRMSSSRQEHRLQPQSSRTKWIVIGVIGVAAVVLAVAIAVWPWMPPGEFMAFDEDELAQSNENSQDEVHSPGKPSGTRTAPAPTTPRTVTKPTVAKKPHTLSPRQRKDHAATSALHTTPFTARVADLARRMASRGHTANAIAWVRLTDERGWIEKLLAWETPGKRRALLEGAMAAIALTADTADDNEHCDVAGLLYYQLGRIAEALARNGDSKLSPDLNNAGAFMVYLRALSCFAAGQNFPAARVVRANALRVASTVESSPDFRKSFPTGSDVAAKWQQKVSELKALKKVVDVETQGNFKDTLRRDVIALLQSGGHLTPSWIKELRAVISKYVSHPAEVEKLMPKAKAAKRQVVDKLQVFTDAGFIAKLDSIVAGQVDRGTPAPVLIHVALGSLVATAALLSDRRPKN